MNADILPKLAMYLSISIESSDTGEMRDSKFEMRNLLLEIAIVVFCLCVVDKSLFTSLLQERPHPFRVWHELQENK